MAKMKQWIRLLGSLPPMLLLICVLANDGDYMPPMKPIRQGELSLQPMFERRRELRSIIHSQHDEVKLVTESQKDIVLDNGIVRITFSYPGGDVTVIQYKGIDNLLEIKNAKTNRGYWDLVWNKPGHPILVDKLQGTNLTIVTMRAEQVEISFTKTYDLSLGTSAVPLNVDKRYILQRGRSGFYAYGILERLEGWPEVEIDQIRIVYKLQEAKFRYMAVSDTRQRIMPSTKDRKDGDPLAYPEAVLLTNTIDPDLRGEVDDKYSYSMENKDDKVHGWISTNESVGFWLITPSYEFHTCGPFKQELTCHAGPTSLSMFGSTHYAGKEVKMKFKESEPWKKVFGPVFVYVNSAPNSNDPITSRLWNNAKEQMLEEVQNWPYKFTESEDYPSSAQRGSVSGQLLVNDPYINASLFWANSAYVGLAAPGEVGSWQKESKGYQFWTQADNQGRFTIKDVRPGIYNLYAWVPDIIGDYKYETFITVDAGCKIMLDKLTYKPPRNGPTLWEIGIPDRTAAEFYIPDPNPTLVNKLYNSIQSEKFRQYGLWERYADLYPKHDLVYTVGASNYSEDWFFAHGTRNVGPRKYVGTTWQIQFELKNVKKYGDYTLQLALASANGAELQVRINNQSDKRPHFTTRLIGADNAIARHGIHGLYWLFSVNVGSSQLKVGMNTIYLTQTRGVTSFQGVMYDYLRLEEPSRIIY